MNNNRKDHEQQPRHRTGRWSCKVMSSSSSFSSLPSSLLSLSLLLFSMNLFNIFTVLATSVMLPSLPLAAVLSSSSGGKLYVLAQQVIAYRHSVPITLLRQKQQQLTSKKETTVSSSAAPIEFAESSTRPFNASQEQRARRKVQKQDDNSSPKLLSDHVVVKQVDHSNKGNDKSSNNNNRIDEKYGLTARAGEQVEGEDISAPEGENVSAPEGQDASAPEGQDVSAPEGQDVSAPEGETTATTSETAGNEDMITITVTAPPGYSIIPQQSIQKAEEQEINQEEEGIANGEGGENVAEGKSPESDTTTTISPPSTPGSSTSNQPKDSTGTLLDFPGYPILNETAAQYWDESAAKLNETFETFDGLESMLNESLSDMWNENIPGMNESIGDLYDNIIDEVEKEAEEEEALEQEEYYDLTHAPSPTPMDYNRPEPPHPRPTTEVLSPAPTTASPSATPKEYEAPDDDPEGKIDDDEIEEQWQTKTTVEELEAEAAKIIRDRNVVIASSVLGVVAFLLLLFTAQQLLENPNGCCGRICKCVVACFNIMCWPCRMILCCGCCSRTRRGHVLVANDASGGYEHDLELS